VKSLILTAFEPFGDNEINSSQVVLEQIPDISGNVSIKKMLLPVLYNEAYAVLMENICGSTPDFIICMGQAGGRKSICIERIALNINDSRNPDNNGTIKTDSLIEFAGKTAYMTGLPVFKMMAGVSNKNVKTSYSAGTFVCNDIFYRLLHDYSENRLDSKIGFIHLPYTEHFCKMPFINSKIQAETVASMISVLGE